MALEADRYFDRRRLKRRLWLWRLIAVVAVVAVAIVAFGKFGGVGGGPGRRAIRPGCIRPFPGYRLVPGDNLDRQKATADLA